MKFDFFVLVFICKGEINFLICLLVNFIVRFYKVKKDIIKIL